MQHPHRSLLALCFAGLAFLVLFHSLAIRAVYPAYVGTVASLSPLLAGFWAVGIVAAFRGVARLAPVLALGFFAAMGYGLLLLAGGSSALLAACFFVVALVGQVTLGRIYLSSLPRRSEEEGEVVPGVRLRA